MSEQETLQSIGKRPSYWLYFALPILLVVAIGSALVVLLVYHAYFPNPPVVGATDNQTWGQFGDFVGGTLNPIFGFLGLLGLLLTLMVQAHQLRQQDAALHASQIACVEQQQAVRRQAFESTFFALIGFHQELVGAVDLHDNKGRTWRGRDCLRIFYFRRLRSRFDRRITRRMRRSMPEAQILREIRDVYGAFWVKHNPELAHYFRTLYRIFKFIDETTVFDAQDAASRDREKQQYASIARAQISNPELALLFYNGLTKDGEKFKPLIEQYRLLENMTLKDLRDAPVHVPLYDRKAYGTNELADYYYPPIWATQASQTLQEASGRAV